MAMYNPCPCPLCSQTHRHTHNYAHSPGHREGDQAALDQGQNINRSGPSTKGGGGSPPLKCPQLKWPYVCANDNKQKMIIIITINKNQKKCSKNVHKIKHTKHTQERNSKMAAHPRARGLLERGGRLWRQYQSGYGAVGGDCESG